MMKLNDISKQKNLFFFITIQFLFIVITTLLYPNNKGDIEKKVNHYINSYLEMKKFSGSILIAQNGNVLDSKWYGMANYDYDIPNGKNTISRIGSLTKQFTAMAIMMLEEQNLLNVDDCISKYISDYPQWE